MQTAIIPLSVNLDKVLEKLNGTGKDRKIRRKDMENIFDDIVKGEAGKNITRVLQCSSAHLAFLILLKVSDC